LRVSTKLFMLCGTFIVAIAAAVYSLITEKQIAIEFARKELAGSRYLATLREIYTAVLVNQTEEATVVELRKPLGGSLKALADAEAAAVGRLQTAELEQALESALRQFWSGQAVAGKVDAVDVLKKARALGARIGDDSNLSLDTQPDSYHVEDIVVSKLPMYLAELCEMQMLLHVDAAGSSFPEKHAARLLILGGLVRSTADELNDDLSAAYRGNSDGSLKRAVDADVSALTSRVASYLSTITADLIKRGPTVAETAALDRSYAGVAESATRAWSTTQAALDRLLSERINTLTNGLRRSLALIGALAGLSIFVALMTHRHIVKPLERLARLSKTVRETNDYSLRMESTSQDEIGRLAAEFNNMLSALAAMREQEVLNQARAAEQALDFLAGVTSAASAAAGIPAVASACIEQICVSHEWQFGQVWYPDDHDELLQCSDDAVFGGAPFAEFHLLSLDTPLQRGQGAPGRAWETKSAVWISQTPDNDQDASLLRLQASRQLGIRATFAFPVIFEDRVLAVYEFFTVQARPSDPFLLNAVEKLGRLLGDIMIRIRSEAALRASEERWRSVFETSASGICLIDETLHYLTANAALQTMLGYTVDELRQLSPIDIGLEDEKEATRTLLTELLQGERRPFDLIKQYRRKDGTQFWGHSYVSVSQGNEFPSKILLELTIDITETRRAQDALRATESELARITRLTAVAQMTASIAHEINQPLASIVAGGNASLRWLARTPPDLDEARSALKRIISDGHRAGEVISGIRAMFKRDNQEKALLEINPLILEVLALLHRELENQRISVRTELAEGLPEVLVNRGQLQQVMLNLLVNAVEAMGTVTDRTRSLRVKSETQQPHDVLITVQDSGPGIDRNNLDRIFRPFFTTKENGMGMGLSICQSIIEAHNGHLSALSEVDEGSVFKIFLPTNNTA
jgi:PAS domain S-box-containing protein